MPVAVDRTLDMGAFEGKTMGEVHVSEAPPDTPQKTPRARKVRKARAQTTQEHWKLLRQVLQKCRELDIYLKIEKCQFLQEELDYLGFVVGTKGIKMDPYKVKAIREWPEPTTKKQIEKL